MKSVLTIAGSDPSGGAGIEADLEMFSRAGVHGRTAITALTVQNKLPLPAGEVYATPAPILSSILNSHTRDRLPDAVKIGMTATRGNVEVICEFLEQHPHLPVVLDPVMRATSGLSLLDAEAMSLLKERLLPRATIITPNMGEASILLGRCVESVADMEAAARELHRGSQVVVVKGGHLNGDPVDVVWDGTQMQHMHGPRIGTGSPRGTGCRMASAIAACLAQGAAPYTAITQGRQLLRSWITDIG